MPAPLHPGPIPFVTLTNWVKAAARCGFNIEPIFRTAGISTNLAQLGQATVAPAVLQDVMEACILQARDHHFPFVLGETFAFDYLPDLETYLATSPTLRDSLRVFDWIRELINPMIDLRLVEKGDDAFLRLHYPAGVDPGQMRPYLSESTFAAVLKFARTLLGSQAPFTLVCFHHQAPEHAAACAPFFAAPVQFNAPHSMVVFPRKRLDQPLRGAFPTLHRQAGDLVERRLAERPQRSGTRGDVEQILLDEPALLQAGFAAVAHSLHLHPRTLQRRLSASGESWVAIRDRARLHRATQWLNNGDVDLETISERLGYADRRSFTRAFARWTGMTPSAFRKAG